ncbi:MAG: 4-alpha-glucanotransferase [Spirochaetaceae bacterium]|jgi:4-alpha-glucanotransferase|nr:4-alpha-glucanotransferase [Spirochaetaceae bacterium]
MGRSAGILLAVSSLPSPYGIGSFGEAARRWVDFLHDAGQRYWQILPLGPTGWGDSPYQSFSAFALSPYYIDLDTLAAQGLLDKADINAVCWGENPAAVDYTALYASRETLLRAAFKAWQAQSVAPALEMEAFVQKNECWLPNYALFMALKQRHGGRSWLEWEGPLCFRDAAALKAAQNALADEIVYHYFVQYTACQQWAALKHYANGKGVEIIGDMPIYVSMDSADTWANHELFQLDEHRRPVRVAGCPPDPFADAGQLWGNPLYDWAALEARGFDWWVSRLQENLALFDVVRIDHFRGFESYFSIPARDKDARNGTWVQGPGAAFIDTIHRAIPGARIIAEDLGYVTSEVAALLERSGFPGMKVLQFAFDSRETGNYMPYTYPRNCVVYSGTHDNPTVAGWFARASQEDTALAHAYFGTDSAESGGRAFIRCALSSVADTCVIPFQDYLGLGDEGRMNTPSTSDGNWQWRLSETAIPAGLSQTIRAMTEIYGRLPGASPSE